MEEKRLTPIKAIRAKCLDCCCGQADEVKLCPCVNCSLWVYRFGHNPKRAGMGNPNIGKKAALSSAEND